MRALATILAYLTLIAIPLEFSAEPGAVRNRRDVVPLVWAQERVHDIPAARVTAGHVSRFSLAEDSLFEVFERTVWWQSSSWLVPLLIVSAVAELLRTVPRLRGYADLSEYGQTVPTLDVVRSRLQFRYVVPQGHWRIDIQQES